MATKNLPAKPKAGAIVSWNDAVKVAAAKQVKAAAGLGTTNQRVSFRGGNLAIGGAQQRNNEAVVLVLAVMHERAYYEGAFDADNPRSPVCYAYGEVNEDAPNLAPHAEAPEPQSKQCKGCEKSEWGSASQGRGQACKQNFKLALVQVTRTTTPDELADAPVYQAWIPPTSLNSAKAYIEFLALKQMPTFAVMTKLSVQPNSKTVFSVHLEPADDVPASWRSAILGRLSEAEKLIETPYPKFEEDAKPQGKRRF